MIMRYFIYIFLILFLVLALFAPYAVQNTNAQINVTSFLEVATFFPEFSSYSGTGSATLKGYADLRTNVRNANTWFEWGQTSSLGKKTSSRTISSSGEFRQNLSNLDSNKFYYFRAAAQDAFGTAFGETIRFRISDGDTSVISRAGVVAAPLGGTSIYPAPKTTTKTATVVSGTSVILNGFVKTDASLTTSAYFEWGKEASLGNKTPTKNIGAQINMDFSDVLFGLTPNKLYYYRAVVVNPGGKTFGNTLTVFTNIAYNTAQVIPTQPVTTTTNTNVLPEDTQYINAPLISVPSQQSQVGELGLPYAVSYLPQINQSASGEQVAFKGYAEIHKNNQVRQSGNVWFEWGTTPALGRKTSSQFFGNVGTYTSEYLTGFIPEKIYYYRSAVQDPYGVAYGEILSFSVSKSSLENNQVVGGGFLSLFGGIQKQVVNINDQNIPPEETNTSRVVNNQNQIAIISASEAKKNGIFPNTIIGWLFLSFIIFVLVALTLYIGELSKKLKEFKSQNKNGDFLNKYGV